MCLAASRLRGAKPSGLKNWTLALQLSAVMSGDKRRSDRVIPMVSDEEMVVIDSGSDRVLAKLMDLSDSGALVYLLTDAEFGVHREFKLSLYTQGRIFSVAATIARAQGRLLGFNFGNPSEETTVDLQAKLIRMEVEWKKLKSLI